MFGGMGRLGQCGVLGGRVGEQEAAEPGEPPEPSLFILGTAAPWYSRGSGGVVDGPSG